MDLKRFIQSYGRKRARGLSNSQKKDITDLYEIYGLKLPTSVTLPKYFFNSSFKEIVLEIGFGRGEHLIRNAQMHKDKAFIGCEPFENGVAAVLRDIHGLNLKNVKIYKGDARYFLDLITDECISESYILFPDPWTKKRHHKRRLLSTKFITTLLNKTSENGKLIIATDCEDYILEILENLKNIPSLSYCKDMTELSKKPDWFLETRYEQKALSNGKKCYYLRCIKG